MRNVLSNLISETNNLIGREGVTILIYKSLFSKRTYQMKSVFFIQQWVLSGIDCNTYEIVMVLVPNRKASTIETVILQYVRQGSLIIKDKWAGYSRLSNLGYLHLTVKYSENFTDPETGTNTQLIENTWMRANKRTKNNVVQNIQFEKFSWLICLETKI